MVDLGDFRVGDDTPLWFHFSSSPNSPTQTQTRIVLYKHTHAHVCSSHLLFTRRLRRPWPKWANGRPYFCLVIVIISWSWSVISWWHPVASWELLGSPYGAPMLGLFIYLFLNFFFFSGSDQKMKFFPMGLVIRGKTEEIYNFNIFVTSVCWAAEDKIWNYQN